jgi:hypothetical protein
MVRHLRRFAESVMLTEFSKGSLIRCIGKIHGSKAREIIVMICMPLRSLGMKQGVGSKETHCHEEICKLTMDLKCEAPQEHQLNSRLHTNAELF